MSAKLYSNFFMILFFLCSFNTGALENCTVEDVSAPLLFGNPYEYIVENTPKRLKKLAEKYFQSGSSREMIDYYAPVSAKNELCRNQSLSYKHSFKNFDPWALKMWDSSGKLPSGILDANFYDLGNYYECLEIPNIGGPYEVKFCVVEVKNLLVSPIYQPVFMETKRIMYGSLPVIKENLYLARCVPASCSNTDLENYYTSTVSEYNMSVKIGKFSCTASDKNDPYSILDWLAVALLTTTIFLTILATIMHTFLAEGDKYGKKGVFTSLLLSFSLYSNANRILTKNNLKSNLSFLNGLRAMSITFVMIAHIGVCLFPFPKINYLPFVKDYYKPSLYVALISTFNLAVDIFVVIGGLLISYLQIKNDKLGRKFNFKFYIIRRFFRIYPAYFFQILLMVTLLYRHFGDGPLWNIISGPVRENCLKNWWTNLLFINNYINQVEACIPPNWYLAVDMQLYLLGPLFLFLITKSEIFRKYGVQLLIIFCNLWTFYDSYVNEYRAGSMVDVNMRTERTNNYLYTTTQSRFSGWLLGLYLGYYLQKIENEPEKKKLSKVVLWIGWSLTALVQVLNFLSMYYLIAVQEHSNFIDSLYNGIHRTIFAMSICWLIYACELGYGGYIYKFLNWYPLQVIGRLSFAAYMTQILIIIGIDATTLTTLQFQPLMDARNILSNIIICYIPAFVFSLMFELPYVNIGRILTSDMNKEVVTTKVNGHTIKRNMSKKDEVTT